MRFMKQLSPQIVFVYVIALALVAVIGVAPWKIVAAQSPTASTIAQKETTTTANQQSKGGWGKFVAFNDDKLSIKTNSGTLLVFPIPKNTVTSVWSDEAGKHVPADVPSSVKQLSPGTWCVVNVTNDKVTLYINAKKSSTVGTFVSYENERLLMLGKDLGERFTKKYGNNLHFNKFAPGVPVYESIDGGEYKLIGVAEKVLSKVQEGTIVTVHAQGDDNITMIQLGVLNKQ